MINLFSNASITLIEGDGNLIKKRSIEIEIEKLVEFKINNVKLCGEAIFQG